MLCLFVMAEGSILYNAMWNVIYKYEEYDDISLLEIFDKCVECYIYLHGIWYISIGTCSDF